MKKINIGEIQLNVVDRGTGPPLLLVHGFPLDHTMWCGQLDDLSAQYRVIAPDLRGFGKSGVSKGKVTMQQLADDLAHMLDALEISTPVCCCGLSMGGYVAWQFLQRHSSRLNRLILCDTRAMSDTAQMAKDRLAVAERVLQEGPAVVVDAMMPKLFSKETVQNQPQIVRATQQVMMATNPVGIAAAQRGMAERPDVREMLPEITIPTLVICGQHDAISPVTEMRPIAEAIPHARYVEIPHVGHMAPLEDPTTVNAAIRDFLPAGVV